MNIETPRMNLRPFTVEDAADLYEILGDGAVMEYSEPPYSFDKTVDFLNSFCIDRRGAVAAVEKESGKLIGYLLFCAQEDGVYELGWFFNRGVWRRGYAYEACQALIAYAFERLNAHKIFAETIDTEKSVPLMRKLGMRPEGIQRDQVRDNHGNWADLYLYGLTETDWHSAP